MREEMTTLGESCQFFNGKAHEKDIDAEGQYVVVNSKFISTDSEVKKFTAKQMFPLVEDDIVMVMSDVPNGKALAKCYIIEENDKYSLNQRICAIRTTEFNIRFLYYQLNRHPYLLAFNNGENQTNLRKGDILNCPLWKPSLNVQKHIVRILDEALDQIEQAQFNIEQNINNTKELFQSKLYDIFSQKADGWEEKSLGEVCENLDSKRVPITKSKRISGEIPYYGASGIVDYVADYLFDEDLLLVSEDGANLLARTYPIAFSISGKNWVNNHAHVLRFENLTSQIFIEYYLNSIKLDEYVSGMAQPKLNQRKLNSIKVPFPSIEDQEETISMLKELEEFKIEIESHYQQKLTNLEDLKKSILQKAFSGELTSASSATTQKPVTV
ncbi:restriction endonuclease subunit S [Gelidibacter sp. F63206]|uniref:restriction endonuclease subunit S n=1 Tax=Gelidibacter sp. F63206 TaxID=2926425 RepID=UPI001FF3D309|nr:restriction endonuclease subunit S [Gelidibacter sp. F63206]MCK0114625.1 restriction endonuclease subunit S [Gelidibacter sp. F63206]